MTIYTLLVSGFMPTVAAPAGPNIGDAYQGGYYAGDISTAANGVADYRLVVAPLASGQSGSTLQWQTSLTDSPGTGSLIDGPANTAAMDDADHPAAQYCAGLSIGGYSDWYLPAYWEMEVAYYNLKPTTDSNDTNYGDNPYSAPSRAGVFYTAGTPPQTSVAAFQSGGSEAFTGTVGTSYWTSTQSIASGSRTWRWADGSSNFISSKLNSLRVRAFRRVAI